MSKPCKRYCGRSECYISFGFFKCAKLEMPEVEKTAPDPLDVLRNLPTEVTVNPVSTHYSSEVSIPLEVNDMVVDPDGQVGVVSSLEGRVAMVQYGSSGPFRSHHRASLRWATPEELVRADMEQIGRCRIKKDKDRAHADD